MDPLLLLRLKKRVRSLDCGDMDMVGEREEEEKEDTEGEVRLS